VKAIFVELLSILGNKENSVDFTFANGKKSRVVLVPQIKSLHCLWKKLEV
jgi:hypothetical protein